MVCRQIVKLTTIFKSDQMITCSIKLEGKDDEFFCSFVYASNLAEERKGQWRDIKDHHDSPIFQHKQWLIFGDFNEILDIEEHSGFETNPNITLRIQDFQDVTRYSSLLDLTSHGPQYTWCNKREEGMILKKLDQILMNDCWLQSFPQSYSVLNKEEYQTIYVVPFILMLR